MNEKIKQLWFPKGHLNEDQRDFLVKYVSDLKPKYCLETGFASGRSCVTVYFSCLPQKMVSIDANLDYIKGAREHSQKILKEAKNLAILEEDSNAVNFQNLKKKYFDDNLIDFAFIDGNHSYKGCLKDLENTITISKKGTVIIIDDYESGPPNGFAIKDVTNAVNDFAKSKNIKVEKWNNKGKGFAILKV